MKTVAIMNNKGGVGKTVTAINFADQLVRNGKKVVLIDCDGQMNLTRFFAPEYDALLNVSVADVLSGNYEMVWSDNLFPITDRLSLLPGANTLYELDLRAIKDGTGNPYALSDFCKAAREDGDVDYMIFDCPPGFTAASVAALMASDEVVIPMMLDGFSFSGMQDMQLQIANLRRASIKTKIAGILVTQWRNAPVVIEAEKLLRSIGVPVFDTVIRRTDKIPESTFDRTPIAKYSPRSAASLDYAAWVCEYLR